MSKKLSSKRRYRNKKYRLNTLPQEILIHICSYLKPTEVLWCLGFTDTRLQRFVLECIKVIELPTPHTINYTERRKIKYEENRGGIRNCKKIEMGRDEIYEICLSWILRKKLHKEITCVSIIDNQSRWAAEKSIGEKSELYCHRLYCNQYPLYLRYPKDVLTTFLSQTTGRVLCLKRSQLTKPVVEWISDNIKDVEILTGCVPLLCSLKESNLPMDLINVSLRYIDLQVDDSFCKMELEIFAMLAFRCPNLCSVKCLPRSKSISDQSVQVLLEHCHKLESISLSGCTNITPDTTCMIGRVFQSLIELNLEHCILVDDMAMRYIGISCDKLRSINIRGCIRVTDMSFITVLENNIKCLEEINISETRISDISVFIIASQGKRLRQLNISGCLFISGECIEDISTGCSKLEYLNVNGSNAKEDTINTITTNLKGNLKVLGIGYKAILCDIWNHEHSFTVLSDITLCMIANRIWDTLEDLSLYSRMTKQVLTDRSMIILLEKCRGLKVLQIDFDIYQGITDDSMTGISKLSKLQKLRIRGLINLTIDTFNQIALLKYLHTLRLHDIPNVSAISLRKIVQECKYLTYFSANTFDGIDFVEGLPKKRICGPS